MVINNSIFHHARNMLHATLLAKKKKTKRKKKINEMHPKTNTPTRQTYPIIPISIVSDR